MFEGLTSRLDQIFKNLRRKAKLSTDDVEAVLREVRIALLEADVNYLVVKDFISSINQRAIGSEVSQALNPAQQIIKIVYDELITTLGEPINLILKGEKPHTILLVGLQGSGKTTAAAKLARYSCFLG
jgi:signal recognition particle subunit SRP54